VPTDTISICHILLISVWYRPLRIITDYCKSVAEATFSCLNLDEKVLIVGDSHACYIAGCELKQFGKGIDDFYALHLGPKLLYSISNKGVKKSIVTFLLKFSKFDFVFFQLGEIDIRVYSAKPDAKHELTEKVLRDYIRALMDFQNFIKAKELIILSPIPQSDAGAQDNKYPRNGSLNSRVIEHNQLCKRLLDLSCKQNFKFIDVTKILANSSGVLLPIFTDDNTHINRIGSALVRKHLLDNLERKVKYNL